MGLLVFLVNVAVVVAVYWWFNRTLFGQQIGDAITALTIMAVHLLIAAVTTLLTWLFFGWGGAIWMLLFHLFIGFKGYIWDAGLRDRVADYATEQAERERMRNLRVLSAEEAAHIDPRNVGSGLSENIRDDQGKVVGVIKYCRFCHQRNHISTGDYNQIRVSQCANCNRYLYPQPGER